MQENRHGESNSRQTHADKKVRRVETAGQLPRTRYKFTSMLCPQALTFQRKVSTRRNIEADCQWREIAAEETTMPEEVELDIREQQEKLEELHREHEEKEREEKKDYSWTRDVSMSTALLAVVAAVAALHSGTLVNEALLEQNKAVKFQAQASDKWAEYQANSIKGHSSEQTAALSALDPVSLRRRRSTRKRPRKYNTQKRWSVGGRKETGGDTGQAGERVGAPHASCTIPSPIA